MPYRASLQPVRLKAQNWDLTGVPVEIGFSAQFGSVQTVVKSTEATPATLTLISVEMVGGQLVSTLECLLTEADTANWVSNRVYTIRVNEGAGWQVVDTGTMEFANVVKRS